jgi:hypothetical protein
MAKKGAEYEEYYDDEDDIRYFKGDVVNVAWEDEHNNEEEAPFLITNITVSNSAAERLKDNIPNTKVSKQMWIYGLLDSFV